MTVISPYALASRDGMGIELGRLSRPGLHVLDRGAVGFIRNPQPERLVA
jgi:hypothetical protein